MTEVVELVELRLSIAISSAEFLEDRERQYVSLGTGSSQAPPRDVVELQERTRVNWLCDRPSYTFPLVQVLQGTASAYFKSSLVARRVH